MKPPAYRDGEIETIIREVAAFIRGGREQYGEFSVRLGREQHATMAPFFPERTLAGVRIVTVDPGFVANPEFYYRAKNRGFDLMPDFSHLGEITYQDLIVFQTEPTDRTLFHALVHIVQHDVLGIERFTELYIRSFIRRRIHVLVPLEKHAYELDQRFTANPVETFSVEAEVRRWAEEGLYEPG